MSKRLNKISMMLIMLIMSTSVFGLNISDLTISQNSNLGLAFPGKLTQYYGIVQDGGVKLARLNVVWGDREPIDDTYSWINTFDPYVKGLNDLGVECVFTFVTESSWGVTTHPTNTAKNQVPTTMSVWQDFVTDCVERYDFDGIDDMPSSTMVNHYYSIVNEWPAENHGSGGWAGTMDELITFANTTYAGIQAANTSCKLILGGWSSTVFNKITDLNMYVDSGEQYVIYESDNYGNVITFDPTTYLIPETRVALRTYYRVLNEASYDYFDLHLYGPVSDNQYRFSFINKLLPNKEFVVLEQGGPNQAYDNNITDNDLFNTATCLNLDNIANDIVFSLWFNLASSDTYVPGGTVTWGNAFVPWYNSDDLQPRGSYWAYMILAKMLENETSVTKISDKVYMITRSDGDVYVGLGTGSMTLPAGFIPASRLDILDSTSGTYSVGVTPSEGDVVELNNLPTIIGEMDLTN